MMRVLLVLRHAKSSWKNPDLDDHDRPLAPRGRRAAPRMGRLMREEGLLPDVAICSTATRARHTLELALAAGGWSCEIHLTPALYAASAAQALAIVREVPDRIGRVLLVGHNPGLEELVHDLTGEAVDLPTAALCRLDCDCPRWDELGRMRNADLTGLWTPKRS